MQIGDEVLFLMQNEADGRSSITGVLLGKKILWHLFIPCSQPCIQKTVIDLQQPRGI